jgi:prepilin peptidase CpaA
MLVLGTLATAWDIRTRRIPNVLTFGGAAAAILFYLATGGLQGAAWSAGGWVIGCVLFLPFFALGGMGAGDVKLMAAIGAWIGPAHAFWAWAFAAVAGGVFAAAVAVLHGYLKQALRNVWGLLMFWRVFGLKPLDPMTLEGSAGPRVAYALPITVGSVLALLLK